MSSELNNYNVFNFKYSKTKNSDFQFQTKDINYFYIISNNDFLNGIKYLQQQGSRKAKRYKKNINDEEFDPNNIYIYTKFREIENDSKNDVEFCLVNSNFLQDIKMDKTNYENKSVQYFEINSKHYIYFYDYKLLEISRKENFKYKNNYKNENEILDKEDSDTEIENILKSLILLYANKKYFFELLQSPIKDEYDLKAYYLINTDWVEKYKKEFNYKEISNILDEMDLQLSYKGYNINLENIMNDKNIKKIRKKIKLPKKNNALYKEDCFYPKTYSDKFKNLVEIRDNICPKDFIAVPQNLFELFFNLINSDNNKYSKYDYKYNVLIGDNSLFIQDQNDDSTFYSFYYENKNLCIFYYFKYADNITFYEEVKNFIKNKGLYNYIIERNIRYDRKYLIYNLLNENDYKIGIYIDLKDIDKDEVKKNKMKIILNKNKDLYQLNKKFAEKINNLKDNNIEMSDINNFYKKLNRNKLEGLAIGIILYKDWKKLYENLYFKQIEELFLNRNDERYNLIEKKIINENYKYENNTINNILENINIFNSNQINEDKNGKTSYYAIDLELLRRINDNENYFNNLEECIYLKNNNEYFILFPKSKILYQLYDYNESNYSFKLKEYSQNEPDDLNESNQQNEEIIQILKGLYDNYNNINYSLKLSLENISKKENKFYLVDEKWIKEYKKIYNYDIIENNTNKDDKVLKKILKKEKITRFLKIENNLLPDFKKFTNFECPINFEIIEKKLFDSMLQELNNENSLKLNSEQLYKISFGDDKIFILDDSEKNNKNYLYYIYILKNEKYKLEYILNLNERIEKFVSNCKNNETFEELLSEYNIDLSIANNQQNIIDEELKFIGILINIKSKDNIEINIKQPNCSLGLENIGATCYMNATIQCLCHVQNVKYYFQNRQLVYNDTYNKNCPLTKQFYKLLNSLWKEPTRYKKYYTPTDFKNCISIMNPLFKGIAANDSKDLIIFIYETIHNEINKKNEYYTINNINNPDLVLFRKNYYSNNSSFLINTFYFEQESNLSCINCGFNKTSYNITNIIIFPLEKVREYMIKISPNGFWKVTLENCFDNFQDKEVLTGINQIWCNSCNQMANASTGNKIYTCPEVMTIILNRGKGLQFDVNFEYPLFLNIEKYVVDKTCTNNFQYELICVLTHLGPSGMSGHFIAFCKSPKNGKWHCYNDAKVSEIDDPRYVNDIEGIPYVLFYQKFNQDKKNVNKNIRANKNAKENIVLFFNYEDKQFYLEVEKTKKIKHLIKELVNQYNIPNNFSLYLTKDDQFLELDPSSTIQSYNLENNQQLTIINE